MTVERRNRLIKTAGYLTIALIFSVITTIIGVAILAKSFSVLKEIKIYGPLIVGVWTAYSAMYLYIRYIVTRDKDIECSIIKGMLICFITISITVWMSCAMLIKLSAFSIPIVFVSLIVSVLLRQRLGYMATVITAVTVAILSVVTFNNNITQINFSDYTLALALSMLMGIFMIYLIRKGYSRFRLTLGAILTSLAFVPIIFIITMVNAEWTFEYAIRQCIANFVGNMIAVSLFTMVLPLYELITSIWTDFKYAEMCSFSQPLLKELKEKASGTFNHSLTVANLAESCAIKLGINPYKARACAYYHDIGKIKNSEFFIENQEHGHNPHDELIPELSAKMIIKHAKAGEEILKQHNFPKEVIKSTIEHHGDTPAMYFYLKAKQLTEGELDIDQYRYEGPRPTSKYSALIMLCDVCEAITRSNAPENIQQLESIVGKAIKDKLLDGQFDECDITIADLENIKKTICEVIPAMLHQRINYERAKDRR